MLVPNRFAGRMEHCRKLAAPAQRRLLRYVLAVPLALFSIAAVQADEAADAWPTEQARVASVLGTTQSANVNARLARLHGGYDGCSRFDIGANIPWERAPDADGERPIAAAGPRLGDALPHAPCDGASAVWAGGNLDFAALRPSSATERSGIHTLGLTIGADRKLGAAVVGAAVGYGRHDWDADADSTVQAGQLMFYATLEPWPVLDVDALVGVGEMSLDSRRVQEVSLAKATARNGSQVFGALAVQADVPLQILRIAPYARYATVRNQLDAYGERVSASEDVLAMGIYANATFTVAEVTVSPAMRVEQRRMRSGGIEQGIASGLSAASPNFSQVADSHSNAAASLTLPIRFGRAASIAFEYALASGTDAPRIETLRASLQTPF